MRARSTSKTRRYTWPAATLREAPRGVALFGLALLALALLALGSADVAVAADKKSRRPSNADSGKVYRWVDDNDVVHFGDQVPPEYAPIDREVLNQQGITVRTEQGLLTEEEIAAEHKAQADKDARLAAERRDQVLLNTYLSVEEIEGLRDRRISLIEGEISITANYLQSLRNNLTRLQAEAARFKPYSSDPDAEPIDEKLARELSDTVDSIALYEKTLENTRTRQSRVIMAFDSDILRFKELRAP